MTGKEIQDCGQRLLVAQGYHGVAVLGVHQVQIGHLVLGGG